MKVLCIFNWTIQRLYEDDPDVREPDKILPDERYWFFKHWPVDDLEVDIIDWKKTGFINVLGRSIGFKLYDPKNLTKKAENYDLVLIHGASAGFLFLLYNSLFTKKTDTKIGLFDVGGVRAGLLPTSIRYPLIKKLFSPVDEIVCHTRKQKREYEKLLGKSTSVNFVPLGINYWDIPEGEETEEKYAVTIGYMERDWQTLFKALEEVPIPLKIIGITSEDVSYPKKLAPYLDFKGYLHKEKFDEVVGKSTLVILPIDETNHATGQLTLLNSFSQAKPVIVSNVTGVKDYVIHKNDCMVYQPKNSMDLKNKINMLWNSPELRKKLGKKARKIVENKYCLEKMSKKLFLIFKKYIS